MAVNRTPTRRERDRLRQLRSFCLTAQTGSMTRAAEQLLSSQPAVSLQVRELEYELEAMLFERRGPRIALTPAGERLYQIAAPVVEALDRLGDDFSEQIEHLPSSELRIAAGPSAVAFVLPRFVKRFLNEYPGIQVHLTNTLATEGRKLLVTAEADLLLGAEEPGEGEFTFRPLFSYALMLITPLDHPLAGREETDLREVTAHPAVVPRAGTYNRQFRESLARRFGLEAKIAMEVDGWDAIKSCVAAGLGISIVPSLCLAEREERLWVASLGAYFPRQSYGVFMRRDRPLSPAARRFIRVMNPDFNLPGGRSALAARR